MNKARILKAPLFIAQESGGLGPAQLDLWLGELKKAGYVDHELREVDGYRLPYLVITEEGTAKL